MKNKMFLTKKTLLVFSLLLSSMVFSQGGVIVLEGNYQGKNIYVQNPIAGSGVGYCVYEVTVNDQVTTDEINSSAFEIDFTALGLKMGTPVVVKIKHKDDCKPKVLNPEVLKPKSTFETVSISATPDGLITWKTKNETGKLPYIIEQFRWNKWVKVGEVEGVGTPEEHEYQFKIEPHSGENQVRVKQVDYSGKPRISPTAKFESKVEKVTFSPIKVKDEIIFTAETLYEIYDSYGNIVKKGFGKTVDVSNLPKGIYYINYDNSTGDTFIKK
ncbi:MAG: hypothetical protein KatS3mg034_1530 [Vicingaceae bacterium]|nr:MAG: hypothetical protein KatS3mg034_1530 [Vicingaceae bacterium]